MNSEEDKRTIWCGNLSDRVTEDLLYELFLQAAPIEKIRIPKDREGKQASYGFVTLKNVTAVSYTVKLLNGLLLFNRKINLKARNVDCPSLQPILPKEVRTSQEQPACYGEDYDRLIQLGTKIGPTNQQGYEERSQLHYGHWDRKNYYRDEKRNEPYRSEHSRSNSRGFSNHRNKHHNQNYGYHKKF